MRNQSLPHAPGARVDTFEHGTGAFWATILCAWFSVVGCATPNVDTRSIQREQPQDVINYVLVIKTPQGRDTAHTWLRNTDFDWPVPARKEASTLSGAVFASRRNQRDCAQEQIDCFRRCWEEVPPNDYRYQKREHYAYCQQKCLNEFMDCLEVTGQKAMSFPSVNDAIDWLKRHPRAVFVGSVILASGFAFVVIAVAGGVLILAPIALS
jgi:hypothetical protein